MGSWVEVETFKVEILLISDIICLVHADYNKPFHLQIDASEKGLGAVSVPNIE